MSTFNTLFDSAEQDEHAGDAVDLIIQGLSLISVIEDDLPSILAAGFHKVRQDMIELTTLCWKCDENPEFAAAIRTIDTLSPDQLVALASNVTAIDPSTLSLEDVTEALTNPDNYRRT